MKNILIFSVAIFLTSFVFGQEGKSPKVIETAFHVSGNCGMCKARIETALDRKGVKLATWDQKTQMLTLAFQPKKITEDQIHQILADAGHETERVPAKPEAYSSLPGCCKYKSVDSH